MIYFIRNTTTGTIKIGYSIDPTKRLATLQTAHHDRLEVWDAVPGDQDAERVLHRRFASFRMNGEWFHPHPVVITGIAKVIEEAKQAEAKRLEELARRPVLLGVPIESVYLAGKITNHPWRLAMIPQWNRMGLDEDGDLIRPGIEKQAVCLPNQKTLNYTGPFYVDMNYGHSALRPLGPHGSATQWDDHGGGYVNGRDVVERSIQGIRGADLFFAWIDSEDCFGTLAEIGYAAGLGNKIVVVATKRSLGDSIWFPPYLARVSIDAASSEEAWDALWSGKYASSHQARSGYDYTREYSPGYEPTLGLPSKFYFDPMPSEEDIALAEEEERYWQEREKIDSVLDAVYGPGYDAGYEYGLTLEDYC